MALIREFEELGNKKALIHKPIKCGYCSYIANDNQRYFLLETYGTSERDIPGKISQSFQLDETGARELIAILKKEFPNLS